MLPRQARFFSPISSGFTAEVMKNDRFSSRRAGGERVFAMFCIAFYRGAAREAVAFYRYLRRFAAAGVIFSPISFGFTDESETSM